MDHSNTHRIWNQLARQYQDRFMDLDLYNDTYDDFCRRVVQPDARILETGCGPGNITRYLLARRPDFRILATDVAPNMLELARQNVPQADFQLLDARDIDRLEPGYDGIVCGFCLPYLDRAEMRKLVRDCSTLLVSGGIFYLSTIEGEYDQSANETSSDGQYQVFVHYYSADELQQVLTEQGFDEIELFRKPYTKKDGTGSFHLIFVVRKK